MTDTWMLGETPLYSSALQSRAQTAENLRGTPGQGGQARGGRKGAPCKRDLQPGEQYPFFEAQGSGCIRHIWITIPPEEVDLNRNLILRFWWDGQEHPSVEVPLADFFGVAHARRISYQSEFTAMPEGRGLTCTFPMPFQSAARATVTNESNRPLSMFFYQVDYTVGDPVGEQTPRFHAQFRRQLRTQLGQDYVILDGIQGQGRFLGAVIGLRPLCPCWWGEGEVKFYLDGDRDYPTICGTGSEDYALSAWGLGAYHGRYAGAPLSSSQLVSFYRWHARDPIYFHQDLRVTMQQLGGGFMHEMWYRRELVERLLADGMMQLPKPLNPDGREFFEFERVDDYCSTAYWYQTLPTVPFPPLPDAATRRAFVVEDNRLIGDD